MDIAANGTVLLATAWGWYSMRHSGQWSTLDLQHLPASQVEMIRFRKNNDLWLCTDHGLYLIKYGSERWQFVSDSAPSPHNHVNDLLLASDGSLWLATGGGIRVYKKNGTVTTIEHILGQAIPLTTGLLEDRRGSIWACSGSGFTGVFKWNGSGWEKVGVGTPIERAHIHRMQVDRNGRIWLLGIYRAMVISRPTDQEGPGAFVYENGTVTRWNVQEGLPSNRVFAFVEGSDGSRWFGTSAGLSRWRGGVWKHWTLKELFSVGRILTIAMDWEGQVWFGDAKGTVGVVSTDDSVRRITSEDGLLSEEVWEIKVDQKARVWFTTPLGLAAYFHGSWTRFDVALGMRYAPPLWPVLPLENEVYVGSSRELAVLSLRDIDYSPPHLYLDQPMTSASAALLRWQAFARWGDIPSDQIETRYRIGNQPWSRWSRTHEANLQNLSPGEYVYEVQSKPLLGDSSSYQTVQSSFTVSLPLSQDPRVMVPAAIVVFVLLAVVIGVTTHTRRLKQKQLREELRREREHAERLAQVDRLKSRFFANVSHEFRTPLTLVL
ncbi:MAG: hypothetical protein AAB393_00370, partial [Bacteroidota bacterium]